MYLNRESIEKNELTQCTPLSNYEVVYERFFTPTWHCQNTLLTAGFLKEKRLSSQKPRNKHQGKCPIYKTFAHETAITIFAPDFAIPFASDLEPTCHRTRRFMRSCVYPLK